jgi:hypothetical protein
MAPRGSPNGGQDNLERKVPKWSPWKGKIEVEPIEREGFAIINKLLIEPAIVDCF